MSLFLYRQSYRQPDGQMDRQMNREMNKQTDIMLKTPDSYFQLPKFVFMYKSLDM